MRELYANRLQILRHEGEKHLKGLLEIPDVRAGLYAVGFLQNGNVVEASRISSNVPWDRNDGT